ncbi:hypothetical protein PQX77_018357 [Marasmius sp. AFHP31]|nr:hypothetical protein PQX77_018357 [Marasmius sp. AFHP31]
MPKKKTGKAKQPSSISTTFHNPVTTLLSQITSNPSTLDTALTPEFLLNTSFRHKSLAQLLHEEIYESTTRNVTPELQWGGDPTRPKEYYKKCFCAAMLVGRAFAQLLALADQGGSSDVQELQHHQDATIYTLSPEEQKQARSIAAYTSFLAQAEEEEGNPPSSSSQPAIPALSPEDRKRARTLAESIWKACITDTINKALFSGLHGVEPGCLVVLGTILLASSHSMSTHPVLCTSKGKGDTGWGGWFHEPDTVWGWKDVKVAVRETKNLPRDNFRVGKVKERLERYYEELGKRRESGESGTFEDESGTAYIPMEAVVVMDVAREHVLGGGEDLGSEGIVERVYDTLMEA